MAPPLQMLMSSDFDNDPNSDEAPAIDSYRALNSGAGLLLQAGRLIVRVRGDDRVSFMHGMCTADVKGLASGSLAPALFLTERAHLIAECFIYAFEEPELWLEVEGAQWPEIRNHLEKLLVADDVELEEAESLAVLDIEGTKAGEVISEVFGVSGLAPWHHVERHQVRIANLPRYLGPAFSIIAANSLVPQISERIRRECPEVADIGAEVLDVLRVENGLARIGKDTTPRTLAVEARFERAISFEKGCYLGQETVERATAHGALKHRLCGIRVSDELPPPGAPVTLEGKEVGILTSVVRSPSLGVIGLAVLHHSAWARGTRVMIGNDGKAGVVCELPFGRT
jgi:folate-binding protein YgfZ